MLMLLRKQPRADCFAILTVGLTCCTPAMGFRKASRRGLIQRPGDKGQSSQEGQDSVSRWGSDRSLARCPHVGFEAGREKERGPEHRKMHFDADSRESLALGSTPPDCWGSSCCPGTMGTGDRLSHSWPHIWVNWGVFLKSRMLRKF